MVTLKVCTSQNGRNDCTFDEVITYIITIHLQLILIDNGFCSAYHPSSISKKGTYALFTFASTPCDNFVLRFSVRLFMHRRWLRKAANVFTLLTIIVRIVCELLRDWSEQIRTEIERTSVRRLNANPYGDWTQIRTEIERKSVRRLNANQYGDWTQIRTEIECKSVRKLNANRTEPMRLPCRDCPGIIRFILTRNRLKIVRLLHGHRASSDRCPYGEHTMLVQYVNRLRAYDL